MTLSTSAVAVCCCSRFAQFVEQTRVLDGDDGLGGKVLNQFDLLVRKRAYLATPYRDNAHQILPPQQRDGQNRAGPLVLENERRKARLRSDVRDVNRPPL